MKEVLRYILFVVLFNEVVLVKKKYSNITTWPISRLISSIEYFCKDNHDLSLIFVLVDPMDYAVYIDDVLDVGSEIVVKFDSEAAVFVKGGYSGDYSTRLKTASDNINNIFTLEVSKEIYKNSLLFRVQGELLPHHPPYITSFKVNGEERCQEPDLELFSKFSDWFYIYPYYSEAPDKFCGRRKINPENFNSPLIVSGAPTLSGLWPWHAALYRFSKSTLSYICGGTLITKHLVLTAAHCVAKNGAPLNPELLGVILGKYSLFACDITTQSFEVFEVMVHEEFNHKKLDNDIAIIKLSSASTFNNYVQPACLWFDGIYDQIKSYDVTGTVVGWGFDRTDSLTKTLRTATMPQVSDAVCVLFQPTFYHTILSNGKKFCAGHQNGTTPCNGDSGGGYVVFVSDIRSGDEPDVLANRKTNPGAWYVKGIVSSTLKREDADICDPFGYTVFTDISKYREWILQRMK